MVQDGKNVALKSTAVEKDLGVHVDTLLKFDKHAELQANKANKLLGMIRRAFTHIDKDNMSMLYKSLVRPHLEYGHAIAYPRLKKSELILESIQRRATRIIPELKGLEYEDRLKALDLPSLYYRRDRGDMIECYKMTHGYYDTDQILKLDNSDRNLRGHSLKLQMTQSTKNVRHHFFSIRVVNKWNALPEDVVSAPSLNAFKNQLDNNWKHLKYLTVIQA